jgi:outer membrane autotransporter protein
VLIGVDVPVADWRVGFFGGYDHSDFNVIGNSAVGGSNDYHLGVYGGTLLGDFALRLGASYSFDDISTDRAVAIGSFSNNLRALYNGGTVQVFGELGYGIDMGSVSLEPFANLAYVSLRTGAFSEAGGAAALSVAANTTEDTIATLGLRPSTAISLGGLDGTLHGMIGWRRTFGQVTPDAEVAFAGGRDFSVTGAPIARNAAAVETGIDIAILQDVTFGLTYGGQFSSRTTDQTGWGSIRVNF